MGIKEIDSSILNTKIVFSLLDGKSKSALEIASDYGKQRMENKCRIRCNELVKNGLLKKQPHENRKGNKFYLNFDPIIAQLDPSVQIYGKEYLLKKFKEKPILELVSFIRNNVKIKTGDYSLFILHINLYLSNALLLDVALKIMSMHPDIDKETKIILKRMKEFLDKKISSPK